MYFLHKVLFFITNFSLRMTSLFVSLLMLGRISAVESVRYGQLDTILRQGYVQSTVLKTRSSYGYQPVTLSAVSYELLQLYITVVRPVVSCAPEAHHPAFLQFKPGEVVQVKLRCVLKPFFQVSYFYIFLFLLLLIFYFCFCNYYNFSINIIHFSGLCSCRRKPNCTSPPPTFVVWWRR